MGKQTAAQRVNRIVSDWYKNPSLDLRARWAQVLKDKPEGIEEIISNCGPMPEATLDDVPPDKAIHYAGRDADATWRINPVLDTMLNYMNLRGIYELDLSVVPMVERMQQVGMHVDVPYFESLGNYLTDLMSLKIGEINELTGGLSGPSFNPNSGDQCADLLFSRMAIDSRKLTKSKARLSTNDKVLEHLSFKHPVARLICDYREYQKLRDSFCKTLPSFVDELSRIHPRFRLTRVSSGRLSCTDPNLLAIPVRTDLGKLIRAGFIAPRGKVLGGWDLDQIEMREMAHQSQDERMIKIFREGKVDIHRQTASWSFGVKPEDVTTIQRYAAKRIGFGVITGITEIGLSEQMGLAGAEGWDEDRCREAIGDYFKVYPGVKAYMDQCRAEARRFGYVRCRFGRIRYLPGVYSDLSWIREEALRQSHSFKISASAQGVLKSAMRNIWRDWWTPERLVGRVDPLLQIHDELITQLDDDPEFARYIDQGMVYFMENSDPDMSVPVKAKGSTGPNWASLKD